MSEFSFQTSEGVTIHALLIIQYKAVQLAYGENFDGRHWTLCGSLGSIKLTVHSTYDLTDFGWQTAGKLKIMFL